MGFGVKKLGMVPTHISGQKLDIHEGKYSGGRYHLIQTDLRNYKAELRIPPQFQYPIFTENYNQALYQSRLSKGPALDKVLETRYVFREAGKAEMKMFASKNPSFVLFSDASNYPYNEGHFIIRSGKLYPLPPTSYPLKGKQWSLQVRDGAVNFGIVNLDNQYSISSVNEGFYVHKVIHDGKPIRLLDEVPGTGQLSITCCRGHINQIFKENTYSDMDSPKRAEIHTELIEYFREAQKYRDVLQDIIKGKAIRFGVHGEIKLPLNTYNHTFWIETQSGEIFCFKTYPNPEGKGSAGVTYNDAPDMLLKIAGEYGFKIKDAYIGSNGKDVRIILPPQQPGAEPEPISKALDGSPFWKFKLRPLANFIAFTEK
jgi:hypothetical protein